MKALIYHSETGLGTPDSAPDERALHSEVEYTGLTSFVAELGIEFIAPNSVRGRDEITNQKFRPRGTFPWR